MVRFAAAPWHQSNNHICESIDRVFSMTTLVCLPRLVDIHIMVTKLMNRYCWMLQIKCHYIEVLPQAKSNRSLASSKRVGTL